MTATADGRKSFIAGVRDDFKALSTKQVIGIIAAIAISLIMEVAGLGSICIGFLLIAVVLYMIPHLLGVMSVKVKALVGVAFVVIAVMVGTFAYIGVPDDYSSLIDEENKSYKDMSIIYDETEGVYYLDFKVNPTAAEIGDSWDVLVRYGDITMISFGLLANPSDWNDIRLTPAELTDAGSGWMSGRVALDKLSEGKFEYLAVGLEKIEGDTKKIDTYMSFTYDTGTSTTQVMKMCAVGSAYITGLTALMFFLILGFSALMRNSAQKTRRKMEAEGRLYPQGYGLCKKCGATVLPGEVVCRKCGEYIEVPEEMRAKKVDFFTCSDCGAEVPSDAKVCPKCGASFDEGDETEVAHPDGTVDVSTETVACPHCGEQVPANADWCPKCGTKIKD